MFSIPRDHLELIQHSKHARTGIQQEGHDTTNHAQPQCALRTLGKGGSDDLKDALGGIGKILSVRQLSVYIARTAGRTPRLSNFPKVSNL